jgi:hypothetical protein
MSRWPLYKGDRYDRFDYRCCYWYIVEEVEIINKKELVTSSLNSNLKQINLKN